jgi:hypothetical protein
MRVSVTGLVPLGYQQFTSLASATTLTVPSGAEVAMISITMSVAGYVRYRDDGGVPTGAAGMTIPSGQNPFLYNGDLRAAQFILGATGTLTSMDVLYYGLK